jgi:fibronectin type 3 domain-containing protein
MFQKRKFVPWFVLFCISSFLITGCSRCDGNKAEDKTAPTVPNGISITAVSSAEVKVSWKPSADNTSVKGYKIYRNGTYLKTTEEKSMTDSGLTPKTKYCYKVSAFDAAGNESAQSTDVCAIL